jgi:hypothetical protein
VQARPRWGQPTVPWPPIYNPAGAGFLEDSEIAGQHLAYVDDIHHEFLSFVHPFRPGFGFGGSMQYLGSGDIARTDAAGNPLGTFSSSFAAYSLTFGGQLNDRWAAGATAKVIDASISDFHARSYAGDIGVLGHLGSRLAVAAVVSNFGTHLKFDQQGDPLPAAARASAAFHFSRSFLGSLEGVYRFQEGPALHAGIQWNPMPSLFLRAGFRTDTSRELSALAGMALGAGLNLWGQEISYAWLPLGDLGNTQYVSLVVRWGTDRPKRNLIYYRHPKPTRSAKGPDSVDEQLIQLFMTQENARRQARQSAPAGDAGDKVP